MEFAKLQKDMIQAMKDHEKEKKEAISSLIAAVKNVAIDKGCRDNIPDDMVDQVILKEIKSIKEQIDTCPADRVELLNEYKAKLAYIEAYAPKLMNRDEIVKFINEKFAEVIASKNKGLIMKEVMPALKGKADGKLINEVVQELTK